MCGIAGILRFDQKETPYPVGQSLLTMAGCLQHRGRDSSGIAIFSGAGHRESIQVVTAPGSPLPEPQRIIALGKGSLIDLREHPDGFIASLTAQGSSAPGRRDLVRKLEAGLPGCTVTAMGNSIAIYKTVGLATGLVDAVSPLYGTHGIAHLRLATESKIDPAHAQPFWGRPYSDIAVTHNGHITNYYKLRQKMEARGFTFASRNDSEIIGMLIGEKMEEGFNMQGAIEEVAPGLDGSFSFIVATAKGLAVARDSIATKPLLFVQTGDLLAIASEQQALHHLLGEDISISEIQPKEIRAWERA